MLEIKFVRQNLADVQKALEKRGDVSNLETFKQKDARRRELLQEIEKLRHKLALGEEVSLFCNWRSRKNGMTPMKKPTS